MRARHGRDQEALDAARVQDAAQPLLAHAGSARPEMLEPVAERLGLAACALIILRPGLRLAPDLRLGEGRDVGERAVALAAFALLEVAHQLRHLRIGPVAKPRRKRL